MWSYVRHITFGIIVMRLHVFTYHNVAEVTKQIVIVFSFGFQNVILQTMVFLFSHFSSVKYQLAYI